MPRNGQTCEIMFRWKIRASGKVRHILQVQLDDNVKAHILQPSGIYEKIDKRGKVLVNAQETFCEEAIAAAKTQTETVSSRVFIPLESEE